MNSSSRDERRRRQRQKNITMLVVLLALAALFYAITIIKMGVVPSVASSSPTTERVGQVSR